MLVPDSATHHKRLVNVLYTIIEPRKMGHFETFLDKQTRKDRDISLTSVLWGTFFMKIKFIFSGVHSSQVFEC